MKDLRISFDWKINKDTKKLEYRDLTGPEKLLLFQHINFHSILSECHDTNKLQAPWSSSMDIIGYLKQMMLSKIPWPIPSKRCDTLYACFVCSCAWIFKALPKFSILHPARYGEVQLTLYGRTTLDHQTIEGFLH